MHATSPLKSPPSFFVPFGEGGNPGMLVKGCKTTSRQLRAHLIESDGLKSTSAPQAVKSLQENLPWTNLQGCLLGWSTSIKSAACIHMHNCCKTPNGSAA
eukprot:1151432-Amphidinium_carterae.1